MSQSVSRLGKLFILRREAIVLVAYVDGVDKKTGLLKYSIGPGRGGARPGDTCTIQEALVMLDEAVKEREPTVNKALKGVVIPQNHYDAFSSANYQGGTKKLLPLAALYNAGLVNQARDRLGSKILAVNEHGEFSEGLYKRRLREAEIFEDGAYGDDIYEIPVYHGNPKDKGTKVTTYHVQDGDFA
jgi:GH24 family phage-related lysozyme (muramidase)